MPAIPIIGAIGGGIIGAIGSKAAGDTQANAANRASQLQYNLGEQSLDFQKQQYGQNQQNMAPWLQAGQGAIGQLAGLAEGGLPQWNQTFQAPTAAEAAATPGYQFQLQQGQQAIQNSAAASGNLLSGGTQKALDAYSQGLASTDYQQTYNNALNTYSTNYNTFQQNQANQFNRLATVAGAGQTAAGQLGQLGQQASNNVAGIGANMGQQVGQSYQNAGAATASGYAGIANSLGGALGNLSSYYQLQQLLGNQYHTESP